MSTLQKYFQCFAVALVVLSSLACGSLAAPTEVPADTAQPAATQPPATAAASPAPTATIAPTAESTTPPPEAGPCYNVFYPLALDNQWTYQYQGEGDKEQIGLTVADVQDSQAVVQALYLNTGITATTNVTCKDGAITNFPLIMLGTLFMEGGGDLQLKYVSGVYAPAYQTLEKNNWKFAWESAYRASGVIKVTAEGENASATLTDSPVKMTWRSEGVEAIKVAAGDYPKAVKVRREITLDLLLELEADGEKETVPATLIMNQTLWFEPYVGLLKQQVDKANLRIRGFRSPVEIESTLELLAFHPAGQ